MKVIKSIFAWIMRTIYVLIVGVCTFGGFAILHKGFWMYLCMLDNGMGAIMMYDIPDLAMGSLFLLLVCAWAIGLVVLVAVFGVLGNRIIKTTQYPYLHYHNKLKKRNIELERVIAELNDDRKQTQRNNSTASSMRV